MKRKKSFRPTPHSVQNSMKIMTGNKTNSSVRDFGDDEDSDDKKNKNIQEKTGVIVSIEKNKINGNGWTVQVKNGTTYKCNCASNLYEIPKSKEKGGVLYPKEKVQCKIKINPVLRVNTITEIIGSKKKKEKLNIDKWTHKDQDTQVIASLKSAISISDGGITFNYDDKSKVTINEKGVKIQGKVSTDSLKVEDKALQDYIPDTEVDTEEIVTDGNDNINTTTNDSMSEINLNLDLDVTSSNERVIGNILDQTRTPRNNQTVPVLTDGGIDELNVYHDGFITYRSRTQFGKKTIKHTEKWIPQKEKNIFSVTVSDQCDYCDIISDTSTFIDYCPDCQAWGTLSKVKNKIICTRCSSTYCHACGHNESNNNKNLKKYTSNYIETTTGPCNYCYEMLPYNKTKQYVDYCPDCKKFQVLNTIDAEYKIGITNQIQCNNCGQIFCSNCGTKQAGYVQKRFQDNDISYEVYEEKMKKLRFIKEI